MYSVLTEISVVYPKFNAIPNSNQLKGFPTLRSHTSTSCNFSTIAYGCELNKLPPLRSGQLTAASLPNLDANTSRKTHPQNPSPSKGGKVQAPVAMDKLDQSGRVPSPKGG
ncbi:hypothetical protein TNCV_1325601 [Trichonephila clavipes]|nr:hypothetical protein TNCV_1325601 [Trichonephila clavipes]